MPMIRRLVTLAALVSLLSLSLPTSAQDPSDLTFEDGIAVGKLTVWFELTAPASFELTYGLERPAWDDPDWQVRMDSAVGVILVVVRSVDRAGEVGPTLPDDQDEAVRLYDAMGAAAATCDRALVRQTDDLADQCVEHLIARYDALLAFQTSLGLFVDFSPVEIERAPRIGPVLPGATPRGGYQAT